MEIRRASLGAAVLVLLLVAACAGGSTACPEIDPDAVNVQQRIATTDDGVEFEVRSAEPFPVRALFPILRIGDHEFSRSRYPDDGSLNTLIFPIPAEEFAELRDGDLVVVHHGLLEPAFDVGEIVTDGWNVWTFGKLNLDLLDCTPS